PVLVFVFHCLSLYCFFFLVWTPPGCFLFPYTTLFRSRWSCSMSAHSRPGTIRCHSSGPYRSSRTRSPARSGVSRRMNRASRRIRSEEHTSELQSHLNLVCRLPLEKKKP